MKKYLYITIILILCFVFIGCTNNNSNVENPTETNKNLDSPEQYVENSDNPPSVENNNKVLPNKGENKMLVVYFSCTNTTENIAKKIALASSANIHELIPTQEYTESDLAYYTDCRADREQSDPNARCPIANNLESISEYEYIFLGYPIWHSKAPKIIYTFLESHDFSGKTIVPFCTSGSSGISASINDLKSLCNAEFLPGRRFSSNASQEEISNWIKSLNLS